MIINAHEQASLQTLSGGATARLLRRDVITLEDTFRSLGTEASALVYLGLRRDCEVALRGQRSTIY